MLPSLKLKAFLYVECWLQLNVVINPDVRVYLREMKEDSILLQWSDVVILAVLDEDAVHLIGTFIVCGMH